MKNSFKIKALIFILIGAFTMPAMAGSKHHKNIKAAVDNPARAEKDRARDEHRKPAGVLKFYGIKPGMTILDMLAGSGYYTEILSGVVGEKGKVIALNNKAVLGFTKNALEAKVKIAGRMDNVKMVTAEINDMELAENSLDAIFLVQSYHDFYYVNEKNGWPRVKVKRTLAEFHKALKKGGVLAVIDHAAPKGSPRESGQTMHRIDPALVKEEIIAAGFHYEASSDLLENTMDDGTKSPFDKTVRGKTNRFILKFVK